MQNSAKRGSSLDWDQVRVFLSVARAGQFLAAGKHLHLDHATVGRRIGSLEKSLGAKLFERSTTGVTLTAMGERLLKTAEAMESAMNQTVSEFSQVDEEISGAVRIGAPDGLGTYYLATQLAELATRHPALQIELVPLPRTFSLARREADLAITIDRPAEGRLTAIKLSDYTLSAYASREHIEKFGPVQDFSQLATRILVTYVSDLLYSPALDYAGPLEKIARSRFECASVTSQMEVVRSGTGIGILHDYAASAFSDLVRVIPEFSVTRSYWLVAHKDLRMLRRNSVLHDFIVAAFKNSGRKYFCPSF